MLPISSMGALYQIYDGDYENAIKTIITSVGITFMTTAVYSAAPALSVILATSYTGYAGYTMFQNGYELYDEWLEYMDITNNSEYEYL